MIKLSCVVDDRITTAHLENCSSVMLHYQFIGPIVIKALICLPHAWMYCQHINKMYEEASVFTLKIYGLRQIRDEL